MAEAWQPAVPGARQGHAGRHARQLVIMAKEPVAGRVKTRMARDIGVVPATWFYRHNLAAVTARLSRDPRWQTLFSVAPATATASRCLPPAVPRVAQKAGDIGQRMQAIFDDAAPGPVVVIGTDIPTVRPSHIAAAFRALGDSDVVFGPATDGGFWLVGLRRTPRVMNAFNDVRWSTADTLRDCLDGLHRTRTVRVATVTTLRDADERADFVALNAAIGRRIVSPAAAAKLEVNY
ncbi:MAG: TIGR04282 family arsenosugar biosynthesis glycosyltransferase [Hyphomicrobiaceae bacterium]